MSSSPRNAGDGRNGRSPDGTVPSSSSDGTITKTSVTYMPDGSKVVVEEITDSRGIRTSRRITYPPEVVGACSANPSAVPLSARRADRVDVREEEIFKAQQASAKANDRISSWNNTLSYFSGCGLALPERKGDPAVWSSQTDHQERSSTGESEGTPLNMMAHGTFPSPGELTCLKTEPDHKDGDKKKTAKKHGFEKVTVPELVGHGGIPSPDQRASIIQDTKAYGKTAREERFQKGIVRSTAASRGKGQMIDLSTMAQGATAGKVPASSLTAFHGPKAVPEVFPPAEPALQELHSSPFSTSCVRPLQQGAVRNTGTESIAQTTLRAGQDANRDTAEATAQEGLAPGAFSVPGERTEEEEKEEEQGTAALPAFVVDEDTQTQRRERQGTAQQLQRIRDRLMDRAPLVEGVPVAEQGKVEGRPKVCANIGRHRRMIERATLISIIIALAVSLGVVVSKQKGPSPDKAFPSIAVPTSPPRSARYAAIRTILEPMSSEDALEDTSSPQHKAVVWLADEDDLAVDPAETTHLTQRFALSTLFFATGGQAWLKSVKFLSAHECNWNEDVPENVYGLPYLGVICQDGSPIVQNISLPKNNLTGSLPEEITLLSELEYFGAWSNELKGVIPMSLGRLKKLQKLLLFDNRLTGSIPSTIGELTELTRLYLDINVLNGTLPHSFGNLRQLEECWLVYNNLTGTIPSSLNNLGNLKEFFVSNNAFSGTLPFTAGSLSNLQRLALYYNEFTGSIPTSIFSYKKLRWLWLLNNFFTGTIPPDVSNLAEVEELDFGQNLLRGQGIPSSIMGLGNLRFLSLHDNNFKGTIGPDIGTGSLSQLQHLMVSANAFQGSLPDTMGKLFALTDLNLLFNAFTGTVPQSLAQLKLLKNVYLGFNSFTGNVSFLCQSSEVQLLADCLGNDPEVVCSCCVGCCGAEPEELYAHVGLYGCFPNN